MIGTTALLVLCKKKQNLILHASSLSNRKLVEITVGCAIPVTEGHLEQGGAYVINCMDPSTGRNGPHQILVQHSYLRWEGMAHRVAGIDIVGKRMINRSRRDQTEK
eukprot:scaffold82518_cov30-Tisochrysis_lutea.AAC.2